MEWLGKSNRREGRAEGAAGFECPSVEDRESRRLAKEIELSDWLRIGRINPFFEPSEIEELSSVPRPLYYLILSVA